MESHRAWMQLQERKGLWDIPSQSHCPTTGKPTGHQGQLSDGTNTDPEAHTHRYLPGQESLNSKAGLTHSNRMILWEGCWHLPAVPPTPVTVCSLPSMAKQEVWCQPRQQCCPEPSSREKTTGAVSWRNPTSGLEAARQDLGWQPHFANIISALRLEN